MRYSIILFILTLAACNVSDKHIVGNRAAEYQDSRNAAALKLPPDLQEHEISDRYYVPPLTTSQSQATSSLLPPGSLAAQQEMQNEE